MTLLEAGTEERQAPAGELPTAGLSLLGVAEQPSEQCLCGWRGSGQPDTLHPD